jgi:dTDP-glucose 4,6-dehydratase
MRNKKVLITGGAGFIGSHLCDLLLAKDFEVICLDNLITGSKENIKPISGNSRFKFIDHDISIPFKSSGALDYVLHFASPASPIDYLNYPIETLKAGSLGTLNALELARVKRAKFLLASTSEVYGDPLVSPQPEEYWGNVNPVGPRAVYDEAKRFAEAATMSYQRFHGLKVKIARIFNTYGPRMRRDDGRVVPNFVMQAMQNKPLTVYGAGGQTRSFCYVSDLVEGIYKLMKSKLGEPVNLGNPAEITILEFARFVKRLTKSKSKIIFKPLPEDDPRQRKPDISRARAKLKWEPRINLAAGLKNTIEWFQRSC